MKPYSKKYLTLALAGILATSIPMTAFANAQTPPTNDNSSDIVEGSTKPGTENPGTNPGTKPGTENPGTNPGTKPGAENPGTNPGTKPGAENPGTNPGTKPGTENPGTNPGTKPGAENPGTNPGTKPGAENPGTNPGTTTPKKDYTKEINIKAGIGERITSRDILNRIPDAKSVEWDSVEFDSYGNRTRTAYVTFKDDTLHKVTVNIDVDRRYNTYGDIDLKNVKYDGKKITGRTASYARIYAEKGRYNDEYLGSADRDGYFSINYTIKKNESIKIYAKDGNKTSSSVKISGTTENLGKEVEANSLSISGKNLTGYIKNSPNTNIRVYFDGKLVGSFKTDDKSYFSTTLSEYINPFDVKNLKFYKEDKASDVFLKVTEAIEGTKVVKGKADYKDTVRVLDSKNNELGRFTVPVSGLFSVDLVRDLIGGEKITVEAKNADGSIKKQEYTVTKKPQVQTQVAYIKGYPDGTFKPQNNVTRAEAAKMFGVLLNGSENFGTSTTTRFTDANGEWYSQAVNYVVSKGLINGYPNGEFKPNDSITRAEFAQMISGYIKASEAKANFTDIENHWAREAIDKLYGNKHINGYPDGTFKPNEKITRAEAVTILNSVFNRVTTADSIKNIDKNALRTFSDVNPDFWAYYNILDASNSVKTSK
ncbi:S-layer homology domain-containing protein [Peptoniphilus sp. MSJ-1]|uniref:S-layer homology domain-containing protein n=1 Tax=Peptoniphilus ovalis TaxID=2841503 RepID=A0ABS6FGH0_9FIRM|nr:S-layer homology domain-containing protein [Peptoniphilus ovalis]MBU5668627.1 S-layer homology domain-containing protein [Peptoniphilus ovalis]